MKWIYIIVFLCFSIAYLLYLTFQIRKLYNKQNKQSISALQSEMKDNNKLVVVCTNSPNTQENDNAVYLIDKSIVRPVQAHGASTWCKTQFFLPYKTYVPNNLYGVCCGVCYGVAQL